MKKVLLIELVHHHECLEASIRYMQQKSDVVIPVVGESVYRKLPAGALPENTIVLKQPSRIEWLDQNKPISPYTLYKNLAEINRNIDSIKKIIRTEKPQGIFVNTLRSIYLGGLCKLIRNLRGCEVAGIMHNTDLRSYTIKSMTKNGFVNWNLKRTFKKFDTIVLLGDYLEKCSALADKEYDVINNRPPKENNRPKFGPKTFVIPGATNEKLRDYDTIFNAISKLKKTGVVSAGNTQVFLLSKLTSDSVARMVIKYEIKDIVTTFDSFIEDSRYKEIFMKSHYCIIPTYKKSEYGKYKISGGYGEATAWGIEVIIPEWFGKKNIAGHRYNKKTIDTLLKKLISS